MHIFSENSIPIGNMCMFFRRRAYLSENTEAFETTGSWNGGVAGGGAGAGGAGMGGGWVWGGWGTFPERTYVVTKTRTLRFRTLRKIALSSEATASFSEKRESFGNVCWLSKIFADFRRIV